MRLHWLALVGDVRYAEKHVGAVGGAHLRSFVRICSVVDGMRGDAFARKDVAVDEYALD